MLPNILNILSNADNTQLGPQPRHPKDGKYQGMAHSSARKGFAQEQSPELADSSKGKGVDDPNTPAEEIEDEGEMIGQGDRPQVPRRSDGIPEGMPLVGKRVFNARKKCPECDGDMVDGECEDCGYDERTDNALTANDSPAERSASGASSAIQSAGEAGAERYAPNKGTVGKAISRVASSVIHPIQTVKGQASLAYRHPIVAVKAAAKSIVHPIKHSGDFGIDKPQEYHPTPQAAADHRGHFGGEPMFADTPHDQTLRAAGASLSHPASREHAVGAMDASMAGDSNTAAKLHKKSAREHLKEAEAHMKGGDKEQADAHLQAALMHHKAATCHRGGGMARNAEEVVGNAEERDSRGRWTSGGSDTAAGDNARSSSSEAANASSKAKASTASGIGWKTGALLGTLVAPGLGTVLGGVLGSRYNKAKLEAERGKNSLSAAEAHEAARMAHLKAFKEAKKSGDKDNQTWHERASAYHTRQRDSFHKGTMASNALVANLLSQENTEEDTEIMNRKNVIDFIVVNCDCDPTGGPEATRNALKQKSNEELLGLKSRLLGLITANAKAEGSFADTKGKGGKGVQVGGMGNGADDQVTYKEDEDASTEDEPESAEDAFTGENNKAFRGGRSQIDNQRSGPMTREEWMATAPPEIREVVRNAEANDNREKLDLHRRITLIANGQHPHRRALILNELQGIKSKQGLQKLLGLVMPVEGATLNEESEQVYTGAGVPQGSITDNQAHDDILVPPTINWNDEHEDARNGKARQTTTASSGR